MREETDFELMPLLRYVPLALEKNSLLISFAVAVARSHPDPAALLEAFRRTLDEDEEEAIPFEELTQVNQEARQHYDALRDMLLRVIAARTG
jgi:hypothetical protein